MAIEILDPWTRRKDRVTKFREYERAGVKEYWMLDPHTRNVEFYVRNDQGKYIQILIDGEGIYRSVIVEGFWLRIEWLWQNPLPDHFDVARELGLIP